MINKKRWLAQETRRWRRLRINASGTKQMTLPAHLKGNVALHTKRQVYKADDAPCALKRKRCIAHKKTALRKNIKAG